MNSESIQNFMVKNIVMSMELVFRQELPLKMVKYGIHLLNA